MSWSLLLPAGFCDVGGRCVGAKATAGEAQDYKQQNQGEGDVPKHLHLARSAGGRSAVGPHKNVFANVAVGVAVRRQVSHLCTLLSCRSYSGLRYALS